MHKPNKITTSKYTPATFLPLNLYYQFTKYNNLFFLITLILLCIPPISPFTPFPYLIAFSLIIGVSMIKDALEDKERHKQDTYINKKLACIIRNGKTQKICVEDIDSGDIILVKENEEVPADIVLLSSNHSNCRSFCFVETSNLDGESNLKRKSIAVQDDCLCNKKTNNIIEDGIEITNCDKRRIARIKDFNVEETGELLNDIKCIIKTSQENLRQNDKNVLLKGSRLKNTTYIIGLAISVGIHTKQSKNQIIKDMRVSLFERMVNRQLCFVFVGYFIVLAFTAMLGSLFLKKDSLGYLYLNFNRSNDALILTGTNYILFSYLVPISLFVTIEIARIFSGLFIKNDRTMQMGSDTTCRNTSVVEDLGIIDHILTDKTGTLTKNEMVLKYIHLYKNPHLILVNTSENDLQSNTLISSASFLNLSDPYTLFVLALLCCNSVERFNSKYEGQSQDEISILLGIKDDGQLVDRSDTSITIMIHGTTIKVPIIMVMDFTSKRQRMSVVVKVKNRFLLFSKGSDQMLLPLMKEKRVKRIIDDNSFYRSLVVGYKELENIGEYVNEYKKIGFERTGERIEEIFGKLEGGRLRYLGTTFVEDSLQDGISDTINDLKRADVRIWMITGDKKETATSCGMLCGMKKKRKENRSDYDVHKKDKDDNGYSVNEGAHKDVMHNDNGDVHKGDMDKNDMHNLNGNVHKDNAHKDDMHNLNEDESKQDANTHNTNDIALPNENISPNNSNTNMHNTTANNNYSISVKERANKYENRSTNRFRKYRQKEEDDDSCEVISASDIIKKLQNNDTIKDRAIVYRASPEQKAKIARLLVHKRANVLSIGDGNNDVMMLQASNIGVGIRGSEGTQASLSADFSVPQFKCLKRLMFVHGRYTFMRFSKLCVNSLYKNLLLIFIQLYYNFFNGYSGRPIYNLFFLSYFNVLFTSIVPFYTSVFDKDRTEDELMNDPKDYKNTSRYFNHKIVVLNVFLAVLKASIIFWPTYFCFRLVDFTKGNGLIGGYSALNNYFSLLVFFTVAFRQYRMIGFCNYFAYIAIGVTWILYFGTLFGVQEFNETTRNSAYHLYGMPVFYLSFIAIFGVVIMIDVMYDTFHHKICK